MVYTLYEILPPLNNLFNIISLSIYNTSFVFNVTSDMNHVTSDMNYVTSDMNYVTSDMNHVTSDMNHVTSDMNDVIRWRIKSYVDQYSYRYCVPMG